METITDSTLERDSSTVAQLAIAHPGALGVFTKYNIDYCCGGHRSLEDACIRIGLDPDKIRIEIYQTPASNENFRPQEWSSGFLADYIVQNHHGYVRKAIPELEPLLDKVCERHGGDSQELYKIRTCFNKLAEELTSHMQKEETVLFPAIRQMEEARSNGTETIKDYLDAPIHVMEHEHASAGDLIKQLRSLSNNYTAPEFACPTFRITYQKLREFDSDLMQHIHLENNILFSRFKAVHG
jgi:regulator of cell morphogenesis and NO signaling